ncbi:PREDICTED: uncharacterized protein LOC104588560 [Nelumbo nucifera]|uniref:Uncharacterized protein LOC104588560 n=1 Tax=Nelumbo nucifera TaxID=4432 RepID=A0A1U7ZC33_NELNU|nr:PREDICTED: uncharacterized protein LOC104588560 [Nelumbo nucifera]
MMNVLALSLVLSSLVAAGLWSPQIERHKPDDQEVIVKNGHRVVVVEYEKQGPRNTRVSISPEETGTTHKLVEAADKTYSSTAGGKSSEAAAEGVLETAKEKFKEASSVLPNLGQGISTSVHSKSPPTHDIRSISSAVGGKASEAAEGVLETTKEKLKEASSVLPNLGQGTSTSVPSTSQQFPPVHDARSGTRELVCDAFGKCKHKIAEAMGKTKEKVADKAHAVEEGAKGTVETVKHAGETAVERTKSAGEDLASNLADKMKSAGQEVADKAMKAEEKTEEVAEQVKTSVDLTKRRAQQNLTEIFRRGREVAYDAAMYAVSPETVSSLMGLLELIGFATAYGMCVWVTFVSSHVLAGALPRQQFGVVQSKIYPVYFRAMAYSIGTALVAHFLGRQGRVVSGPAETLQAYNLLGYLVMVLVNLLYLEPQATKVMFERMKAEKEEGRGRDVDTVAEPPPVSGLTTTTTPTASGGAKPIGTTGTTTTTSSRAKLAEQEEAKTRLGKLNQRLKQLNTYSSFLNVLTLMGLTWHLVYLGQRLQLHRSC